MIIYHLTYKSNEKDLAAAGKWKNQWEVGEISPLLNVNY